MCFLSWLRKTAPAVYHAPSRMLEGASVEVFNVSCLVTLVFMFPVSLQSCLIDSVSNLHLYECFLYFDSLVCYVRVFSFASSQSGYV